MSKDPSAYRIAKSGRERRLQHSNDDKRGSRPTFGQRELSHLKRLITTNEKDGRFLRWIDLKMELESYGVIVSEWTIRNSLGDLNFHSCIACSKCIYILYIFTFYILLTTYSLYVSFSSHKNALNGRVLCLINTRCLRTGKKSNSATNSR
jgi:hypothetical protein